MSRSIHKSVFASWVGLSSKIVIAFFMMPYIAGKLGVDGYGEYFLLVGLFGYSVVLDFGFRAAIRRYVGQLSAKGDFERLNRLLGGALQYYTLLGLLVVLPAALLYRFPIPSLLPNGAMPHFFELALKFSFVAASMFHRIAWQSIVCARERYDISNAIDIVTILVRTAFIIVFLEQGYRVAVVIYADLLDNLLNAGLHGLVVWRRFPEIRPAWRRIRRDEHRTIASYGVWAFVYSVASSLRFRTPALVLGWAMTTSEVTLFNIAARLQNYVFQFGTAMNQPFGSRVAILDGSDEWGQLRDLFVRGTRLLATVMFSICAVLFLFADRFLVAWMGAEFEVSAVVLRILLPAVALEIIEMAGVGALYSTGRHRGVSILSLIEAVSIVGLTLALVGPLGVPGAAAGVAIPIGVNKLLIQPIYTCRKLHVGFGLWLRSGLLGPTVALLVALPLGILLRSMWPATSLLPVMMQMAVSLLPFGATAWIFGLDQRDKDRVGASVGRRLGWRKTAEGTVQD